MIQINVLILDDIEEDDLEDLLGEIRYRVKYTDGVGVFEVEHERR
jgi:hypothetical protein